MAGIVQWGAGAIAKRYLGADTPKNRRLVYRWSSELGPGESPVEIFKAGRAIYAREDDTAAAVQRPASATAEDDTPAEGPAVRDPADGTTVAPADIAAAARRPASSTTDSVRGAPDRTRRRRA